MGVRFVYLLCNLFNPVLIPETFTRKMPRMYKPILKIGLAVTAICLMGITSVATPSTSHRQWHFSDLFARNHSIWKSMSRHFRLNSRYYNNYRVKKEVQRLKHHQYYIYKLTRNAQPYIYYVLQQTKKRHIPDEIALIPMIESTYNPFDYSHVGATGLWQLMPGTASGFGLKINWWYDGRRDVVASTNTALNYLQYLHDYFHSWLLAIAAYNSGEGTVINAIRYNRRHHRPTDFWDLPLPQQTKNYVPKLLALAAIIKYHAQYGLRLIPVPNKPFFTTVTLKKQMSLQRLAKLSNISEKMFRRLNPGFRRWATMPNHPYHILVPISKKQILLANLEKANRHTKTKHNSKWVYHRVRPGESLSTIASRYDTSVGALRNINKLKSNMILIGENLLIPVAQAKTTEIHINSRKISEDGIPGPKRVVYLVKRHDSMSRIAHRYHVTVQQIYFWNKFNNHTSLKTGQQLVIWVPRRYYHRSYSHHSRQSRFYHRVRSGDTLGGLAHRYGTTVAHIRAINHLASSRIFVGEKLRIS